MQQKIIRKDTSKFQKQPNLKSYNSFYNGFSLEKFENQIENFSDGKTNMVLNVLDRHVKGEKKNKTALIYNDSEFKKKEYTYQDLFEVVNKFANVLNDLGVKKGDRVFLFLPTIPERYTSFLGVLKTGAIAGVLFSAFQEMALLDRLKDGEAKIVVTNSNLFPRIEKIWKNLPSLEKVIVISSGEKPQTDNVIDYETSMKNVSNEFETAHMDKDEYAYMLYTSGTTGKPKGVVHSHGDMLHVILTTKYVLDLQEDDVYWCTADMGWVTGVVYGLLGVWGLGGTSVIYGGRFSPDSWYKVLEENKVSVWYTAPTALRMLMGAIEDPKKYNFSNLRHIASVGEPLNLKGVWWIYKKFEIPAHDTWWQTETGGMMIVNFPSLDIKPGSMGKPFPGVRAAIVDENGKELQANTEGDLVLDPDTIPSIMKTIWKNDEKYKSYFANGWYMSGDRAYKDEDGYFWFVGRFDDVVNTSGERIGPFEVESALIEHPGVLEAGVIGKPDKLRGQIIKAFVVLQKNTEESDELKENIVKFIKKNFSGHAYPREIEFVDNLPKTKSGKIMRRVLKARELGLPEGDISTLEDY